MSGNASHDGHAFFPTTDWSLLLRAGDGQASVRREALGILLRRYLPALRVHLTCRRHIPTGRADDLLQSFVCERVLEHNLIAHAERQRGNFRSFLLACLEHHVSSELRRERAQKRAPQGRSVVTLDEAALQAPELSGSSPEFDRAWVKEVVRQTLQRMRRECRDSGRHDLWIVFQTRLVEPLLNDSQPQEYSKLAEIFDLKSVVAASNLLTTAKRMFVRCLRDVIGEYAAEDEVRSEIRALLPAVLGRSRHDRRGPTGAAAADNSPCREEPSCQSSLSSTA